VGQGVSGNRGITRRGGGVEWKGMASLDVGLMKGPSTPGVGQHVDLGFGFKFWAR
jgi:hypothetical protein